MVTNISCVCVFLTVNVSIYYFQVFYYPRVYCKTHSSLFLQQLKVNTNCLAYCGFRGGKEGGGGGQRKGTGRGRGIGRVKLVLPYPSSPPSQIMVTLWLPFSLRGRRNRGRGAREARKNEGDPSLPFPFSDYAGHAG